MNKPWYKKWWGIILLILFVFALVLLIAFAFLIINITKQAPTKTNSFVPAVISPEILGDDNYWIGSANPKLTIVEFGDFGCSVCKTTFPMIRELGLKYKNDVKIIFRDYPVITESSGDLALAARCAGEQGFFWLMHDKLFLNQGISTSVELKELAKQTGVNMIKFDQCYESKKYLAKIQKDLTDGVNLGVESTPTWFINGSKVVGDIPQSGLEEIIQTVINQ